MNNNFEREYYESDAFWQEGVLGSSDKIRIQETAKLIPSDVQSIIDVGCGNGLFCNYLFEQRRELGIIGLDRSKTALEYVKAEKRIGDITSIPFPDGSFDCVSCLQVLEHLSIEDFAAGLKELSRVSKKYVLTSVPYNEEIEKNVTQCPYCRTIFNVDLHLRSFNHAKVTTLLDEYGYECVKTQNIISGYQYWGYDYYLKVKVLISNKPRNQSFQSPICPICGFKNKEFSIRKGHQLSEPLKQTSKVNLVGLKKVFKSLLTKKILKNIWPRKKKDGYWIIALYKKQG